MVNPVDVQVSVVVVNFNTPELVQSCVDSLRRHLAVTYEVIVVESGLDRSLTAAMVAETGIRHIPTSERRGFGQANNLGAAAACGRYLWLLNSDTIVPDGRVNGIFSLLDRSPRFGALSPVLFNDRGLRQRQPDFFANFQRLGTVLTRRLRPHFDWDDPLLPEIVPVEQITAAAMVIRADLFRQLGGFDERYFMYLEDDDLCYRARQLGALVGVATGAVVVHLQGRSLSNERARKRFYDESQNLFWKTHRGRAAALLMRALRLPWRVLTR